MSYPKTGHEVYVSFSLSNTMLSGIGKGTIEKLKQNGVVFKKSK